MEQDQYARHGPSERTERKRWHGTLAATYQFAVGAQDEALDVPVHHSLKRVVRVGAVDDGSVRLLRVRCLGPQLATEEFVDFAGLAVQACRDGGNVGNGGLDSVAGTFDFPIDGRHPVTVLRIIDRCSAGDVDDGSSANRHGGQCWTGR